MLLAKRTTALLTAILLSTCVLAQKKQVTINYPDRYRLDLPREWKKPKLITAITEILPRTIDELKDRDFCTDGKALYCVRLTIDSIRIDNEQSSIPIETGYNSSHTFNFTYHFYAALTVYDSLEFPIARLRLVPTEESFDYSKRYSGRDAQNITYARENVYDTSGHVVTTRLAEDARAFNTAEPKHDPGSVLTLPFLMDICEQKIYGIKKLLKQMN